MLVASQSPHDVLGLVHAVFNGKFVLKLALEVLELLRLALGQLVVGQRGLSLLLVVLLLVIQGGCCGLGLHPDVS